MNPAELWAAYREGSCSVPSSLLLGGLSTAVALVVSFFALRPLVRAFSRKDIPKVLQARLRRTGFALTVASIALGAYVAFHALWPPDLRAKKLAFEISELLLILFAGYVFLEILLSFFGDFLPAVRAQAPLAPIIKDLMRAVALMGVALLGVKTAFPDVDIGAIMTTSAILSVVVGLALQESLSNIFAGLMLTIDRPFKAGDWIEIPSRFKWYHTARMISDWMRSPRSLSLIQ